MQIYFKYNIIYYSIDPYFTADNFILIYYNKLT